MSPNCQLSLNVSDTYVIDVKDPENALDSLMFVLAIDAKKCTRNKRQNNQHLTLHKKNFNILIDYGTYIFCVPFLYSKSEEEKKSSNKIVKRLLKTTKYPDSFIVVTEKNQIFTISSQPIASGVKDGLLQLFSKIFGTQNQYC